ncbi:MAG: hypothetical protein AAGA30_11875, partial [Planctomycetota bacterium]
MRDKTIFENCGHHLDVTHLASIVRIARACTERFDLELALDLSIYGTRLDPQLQYPGDFPFEDNYLSHRVYFEALLDPQPDKKIGFFQAKLKQCNLSQEKSIVLKLVIDLLSRTGKSQLAIEEALSDEEFLETELGISSLIALGRNSKDFEKIDTYCRSKNDLLGFALSSLSKRMIN